MHLQNRFIIGAIVLILILAGSFLFFRKESNPEFKKDTQESMGMDSRGSGKLSVAFKPGMTYPPTIGLSGPADFLERAAKCVYSVGFFGSSGNGLEIDWGDGTQSPDTKGTLGQSCEGEMRQHTYSKAGTYTITVHLWHPGPADEVVTDWKDSVKVTIP